MRVQGWMLQIVVVAVVLTSCGATSQPGSNNRRAGTGSNGTLLTNAQGYWEAHAGDVSIDDQIVGDIYNYDWYALEVTTPDTAIVTWDNGLSCPHTEAQVQNNEIHLTVGGVETVFVIHDQHSATVTFQQGEQTWVKQLEKVRVSPHVTCA